MRAANRILPGIVLDECLQPEELTELQICYKLYVIFRNKYIL
jgi:hypothetical protein